MEARFQSPVLGRFLRVDPLAATIKSSWLDQPQRLNLYAYCANAPMGNVDPSGTDLVSAYKGFGIGVAEGLWECVPKDKYLLNPATAGIATVAYGTVAVYNKVAAMGTTAGDITYAAVHGDYKKAAVLAIRDERVEKIMDPKTSDKEMGRMIGNPTGKAIGIIAMAKAMGGKGPPKGEPPPPPSRTVVGPPMSRAGQTAPTQPTIPKGPTTQVGQPVEHPTGTAPKGFVGKLIEREQAIAEANKTAESIANRLNQRMRDTQELRDWLTKEGQGDLVRKYVGDILND
jgi:hypothetical protein